MSDAKYWIWLQDAVGIRADTQTYEMLDSFGSAENIYRQSKDELKKSGIFNKNQLLKLENKSLDAALKKVEICKKNGWKTVTPDSRFYPLRLKEIENYPLVLYVDGDESLLIHDMLIGVIGTRNPSQYGIDVADTISKGLVKGGAVIVSGGALGIDSIGHTAAVENGGKTLLVMGCGLGNGYLSENEELRRAVAENGALVTEYPPFCPPTSTSFIMRNRITAGLCNGVLVVEAGRKSGSLSTARKVIKYGRDLFVITGDAKGTSFIGTNELAQTGAKVIFAADDILALYGYEIRNRDSFNFGVMSGAVFEGIDDFPIGTPKKQSTRKRKNQSSLEAEADKKYADKSAEKEKDDKIGKRETDLSLFSPDAKEVYAAIEQGIDTVDEIAVMKKIKIRNVLVALTELEMEEVIACVAGNRYVIN